MTNADSFCLADDNGDSCTFNYDEIREHIG